jgi:DNA-binding IclR family transcriptional regulator
MFDIAERWQRSGDRRSKGTEGRTAMARNIQSLERAAAMLRLLAGGERRLGLSDIASSLGLAKGTAHGILRTLQQEGFVEQDGPSGRYQLGAELLRLGTTYLDVHELRARALVWTDDLARSSGESVYLGVLHQQGVLIVHHVFRPDDSRQVLEVGAMQPLHSTALGKVLSAYDPVAHSEVLDAEREEFTARTVCAPEEFEGVLDLTRARGYAADVEETWTGVASVAAPIHNQRRMPVGAVGVTGAVERVCKDGELRPELIAAVRDCARAVSRDLGAGRF